MCLDVHNDTVLYAMYLNKTKDTDQNPMLLGAGNPPPPLNCKPAIF